MPWITPRRAIPLTALSFFIVTLIVWFSSFETPRQHLSGLSSLYHDAVSSASRKPFSPGVAKPENSEYSRTLVVAKTNGEDVGWIRNDLPDLPAAVYEVDKPNATYRVPRNKGNEAMVYLTYLIDHYDELADTTIFIHAHSITYHNNILLDLSTPATIKRLQDDRVWRQGFMNLRCHFEPGCPGVYLNRTITGDQDKSSDGALNRDLFKELFPGHKIPPVLSEPCCAQFAVSRERVRDNPKKTYEHLREWLLATPLNDADSGRVFEYIWQYLFTRNAEVCPSMNACYCDGYGICFGDDNQLDDWMEKLKRKEKIDEEMDLARRRGEGFEVVQEIEGRRVVLEEELEKEKEAAYKRGDEAKNRALAREPLPE
ncbi:hypothetical protein DM02DRAFT_671803 [Periconia macrospinosa]|uniref:DUF3431 domain-containing protein n=1 Tax=Periconia macrospinosa TaxID=97972 RepID=A0A2V1DRT3_9PLEO|nr:hypothetical protein DM02DRAFT_671803 [Periconia macrospinosa]